MCYIRTQFCKVFGCPAIIREKTPRDLEYCLWPENPNLKGGEERPERPARRRLGFCGEKIEETTNLRQVDRCGYVCEFHGNGRPFDERYQGELPEVVQRRAAEAAQTAREEQARKEAEYARAAEYREAQERERADRAQARKGRAAERRKERRKERKEKEAAEARDRCKRRLERNERPWQISDR